VTPRLVIRAGGEPGPARLVALGAAVAALLEAERAPGADPLPPAYRSRWRRAAIAEGLAARRRP
jgi:hypothetical protein